VFDGGVGEQGLGATDERDQEVGEDKWGRKRARWREGCLLLFVHLVVWWRRKR